MAEMGELVNNLQNTQREKKPYISSSSNPAKMKTATECIRKSSNDVRKPSF